MSDLENMPLGRLLGMHAGTMEELYRRGIARTANNPTGNLAEYLFCRAFSWQQAPNLEKGFDATDGDGKRYQIKGRRLHRRNKLRQLSAIRDVDGFDVLATVLFDDQYRVSRAAMIPRSVVRERSKFVRHTNSHRFMLTDDVWNDRRVKDVTDKLRAAESEAWGTAGARGVGEAVAPPGPAITYPSKGAAQGSQSLRWDSRSGPRGPEHMELSRASTKSGGGTMEVAAYRLFYDNILDFKTAATQVESEIGRHGIRSDSGDPVPGMNGRAHRDMWVSMKTVSHFNLGTALELMLKLLLRLNNIPLTRIPKGQRHLLTKLHDAVPEKFQNQLESTFQASRSVLPDGWELIAFINTASPALAPGSGPPNRDISCLRGFFEYFDEDAILWQKRYSWELVGQGRRRHYVSDISVFVELINRVMRDIERY